MNASIHDVAKRAGVSISTVSRVINNSAGVKESKAEAVKEALLYYDYEPSQFGRGLVTGSSKMIGVYYPAVDGNMFQPGYILECLRGIDHVLSQSQYSLLLISELESYYKNNIGKPKFLEYVNQKKIDGLLVLTVSEEERMKAVLEVMLEQDFPVGYIGKRFTDKGISVYAGYEEYTLSAFGELFQNGHSSVLIIDSENQRRRVDRVIEKARKMYEGLEINTLRDYKDLDAVKLTKLLHEVIVEKKVTGILCEAMVIVTKCLNMLNSLGIRVPEDISMIGIENTPGEGDAFIPPISCYHVPASEMGETIAHAILMRLQGEPECLETRIFKPEYHHRESVKCLK